MSPDVAASVRARLLEQARRKGEEFELFLVRFASERFLYRLGVSPLRDRLILKGAGLLTIWMADPYRSTRDLDFLAFGPDDERSIRGVIETVCAQPCPQDGLRFDLDSLTIELIREDQEYHGQRAAMLAYLGSARIRMKIDVGFGDAVVPSPQDSHYPTLLPGLPVPRVRVYPLSVSVAEKFEAMVRFGAANSRMKDFHDIWALSSAFSFSGFELRESLSACFQRRRTEWTGELPSALSSIFYLDSSMADRWHGYLRSGSFSTAPPEDFDAIGARICAFIGPVRESINMNKAFEKSWNPGGPWV